jgi:ubiquinone/menaquinone biosynthesis C-methylase UbiE
MPGTPTKSELRDIFQWDIANWKRVLPFWHTHFVIKPGMKVLALGEREGGTSIYFARLQCEVVCSDCRDLPPTTRKLHAQYGVSDRITYKTIDMRQIDFPDDTFDIVVFKSVIGALGNKPDQDIAAKDIHRVLKKGGALLYAENAEASGLHVFLRKRFIKWAVHWRYITAADLRDWTFPFTSHTETAYGVTALFGRSEGQRRLLAGLDRVLNPIIPRRWKYIFFGVMIK